MIVEKQVADVAELAEAGPNPQLQQNKGARWGA
jgi:hypothetical protein